MNATDQDECCHPEADSAPPDVPKSATPQANQSFKLSDYLPLGVILGISLLFAATQLLRTGAGPQSFMHDSMGLFLVILAMFKLFDLRGFADGFAMYDLLAMRKRQYALAYPFIELGLGLAYLARFFPGLTYIATLVIMLFGLAGILNSLISGRKFECACMGTVIKVPLTTISAFENAAMALMALIMLF